ncbi:ABC transporter ATP-binding protein [Roseicitreum antarcticum]|uniref:Oligopeptide/dipeptide ABC transporter, ATP-binding protein, C-terminal domain-containing protein n=1 Tax=Roseicitreum antarcticum TaxID=564137 RepID=A0A1H2YZQ1_9RHOB|nr:oligopeptide/dipeptide ABC transporter ATP-binding protein [Roseicitreum antarcticum]SDX10586.1 oligopeptide/dipeptide ABC transporter, ATP-binding protein, C-terminal domain-containing protein [Roseicitreum antarcticum]
MTAPLLDVRNLTKTFGGQQPGLGALLAGLRLSPRARPVHAVSDVSFTIQRGEVMGVVGESGCGKSTLGRMVAGLLTPTQGQITQTTAPGAKPRPLARQMIFQDPFSSLNPRHRVVDLIGEAPRVHRIVPAAQLDDYTTEMMERCGIDPSYAGRFAHQFSGGQRQRIGIARALAVRPEMLIADEAVSALDVSVQAQIINLFMQLRDEYALTYLFISHDLGVVRHLSDRVLVMYLGRIVESGPVADVFDRPNHPYTSALIEGVPRLDRRRQVYQPIQGDMPSPLDPPKGCHFHPRCPHALPRCRTEAPRLRDIAPGRQSACHLNDQK